MQQKIRHIEPYGTRDIVKSDYLFLRAKLVTAFAVAVIVNAAPPAASVRVNVEVPPSMRTGAFASNRTLLVPPGFRISVLARVPGARFLAVAPNGDIFVSQPGAGKVLVLRERPGADLQTFEFASSLRLPHDIVFHPINGIMYVYIAESNQISRTVYWQGDVTARALQPIITNLPDGSTPELQGPHAHALKNIVLDRNHKLYLSNASTCNACVRDALTNPIRGSIYQYNADGTGRRLFARGIRNAEGLAMLPGTDELWVVVNGRDEILYPRQDATGDYKKLVRSYVDNHPPEIFTRVREAGDYGWPFCNPTQDSPSGFDDMLLENDVEADPELTANCSTRDRPTRGIQAHSAPLGLSFLHESFFPVEYRFGAVVALHGSWNRSQPTGYKVIYLPWNSGSNRPEAPIDLVSGWLDVSNNVWGRPVDAVPDAAGNLLISDDASGTVYRLAPNAGPQPCIFTISTAAIQATATGGAASRTLSASSADCAWTASSSTSWLQVYPLTGTGSASIEYNVFPNFSSVARTAIVQVAGRTFSVTQPGATGTPDERFVGQMYFNFLGRRASPEEIAFHVGSLHSGVSRDALAWNFMNTAEFNLGGRFVAGLYVGILARDAEYDGWLFQRNATATGVANPVALTGNFLNSAEFAAKFGQLTNAQFAALLYRNILLREPDSSEVALQVNALIGGTTREALAHAFLKSPEFQSGTGARLTAFLLYATILLRGPSSIERDAALAQLAGGTDVQALIRDRVDSAEFVNLLK
jgi:glucose/arabinose dehydrogenase